MTKKQYAMYLAGYIASRLGCLHGLHGAVLTCVAFTVVGGCAAKEPITSWSCPRLLEVKREWDVQAAVKTQDKSEWQGIQGKLNDILKSSLSRDDLRNLGETSAMLGVQSRDRSEFENALLVYLQIAFIDSGDRENLVKLLSTRCELHMGVGQDLEFCLAYGGKEKLRDPILVLGEAFSMCQVPEVRHDLAGSVRRAFLGHGIRGKDDAEYVNNAMQWYEREKGHLSVNEMYASNTSEYPAELFDQMPELYEKLEKSPAEKRPMSVQLDPEWYKRNAGKWLSLFEKKEKED